MPPPPPLAHETLGTVLSSYSLHWSSSLAFSTAGLWCSCTELGKSEDDSIEQCFLQSDPLKNRTESTKVTTSQEIVIGWERSTWVPSFEENTVQYRCTASV